jgi:hypothetical protein
VCESITNAIKLTHFRCAKCAPYQSNQINLVGFARLFVRTNCTNNQANAFSVRKMRTLPKLPDQSRRVCRSFVRTNCTNNQADAFSVRKCAPYQSNQINPVGFARLFVRTNCTNNQADAFSVRKCAPYQSYQINLVGFAGLLCEPIARTIKQMHFRCANAHPTKATRSIS